MKTMVASQKENFCDFQETEIFEEPLIFTSFIDSSKGHDPSYRAAKDFNELKDCLEA